jgi:NAD(P)-dependent dehydrogenase (short-subunit alcohol dehydrogenase family)
MDKMNIIITGAGKGIGFALVENFLKKGHAIIAISRKIGRLKNITNEKLLPVSFDLNNADYTPLISLIRETFPRTDILINNAGLLINKSFEKMTDEDFDLTFDTNVKAAFRLSRDLLPLMNDPSHIVNISSMGGFQGSMKFPGLSLYSAAKGALAILTESMALELKEQGIAVNALALGAVQTEMLSAAFPGYKAPLHPEEMATFIADFALTGYRYFNGKILPVSMSTP